MEEGEDHGFIKAAHNSAIFKLMQKIIQWDQECSQLTSIGNGVMIFSAMICGHMLRELIINLED